MKRISIQITAFILFVFFTVAPKADAYLDPGTGSYLVQIMTAAFFGGAFFIATCWKQVKQFFVSMFSRKGNKTSEKPSQKD